MMYDEGSADPMRWSYSKFVAGLFVKPATPEERLAHAAVGIIGEIVELAQADTRENQLEELGDLKFYIEAAKQQLPEAVYIRGMNFPKSLNQSLTKALYAAADFLDLSKKVWIYAAPIEKHEGALRQALARVENALERYEELCWFTSTEVELGNREKLIKRYPGAGYTDAAAQARADKPAGA